MVPDLLQKLEQKVASALEIIELLQQQNQILTQENASLKNEQDQWRHELVALIKKLDRLDTETRPHEKMMTA